MNPANFVPTVYFREDSPFCLRAKMFLLEKGAQDDVEMREFMPGTSQEYEIRG